MKEKTLTFLGKDSGFGEHNNSAYIEDNNKLIIIDCGFTVFEQLKNKFDFNKYSNIEIIITHLHNDHAGSLSQITLYLWFIYNKKVTIYSKCERIRDYLEITGTPKESYEIKTESLTKELYENDILIFMSDGYMQEPENIILEILKENYSFNSEKICSLLNEKLAKLREVEDDKTLIVIKLEKIREFKKENQVNNLQRST